MSEFKSIVIPEEILICSRKDGRAFAAPADNAHVVEQARSWAGEHIYDRDKKETIVSQGHEYRYKNGEFEFELKDSADNSWNGGKLSFWNCTVIAPDGNKFIIGINQTLLCDLLQNCTLVNGKVQGKVWLGREKTNTGVYVDTMPQFKQAREEKLLREFCSRDKTTKYEVGDVVRTLTQEFVYGGVVYTPVSIEEHYTSGGSWSDRSVWIHSETREEELGPYHLYIPVNSNGDLEYADVSYKNLKAKKTRYVKTGKHLDVSTEELVQKCFNGYRWFNTSLCLSTSKDSWMHTKEEIFQKYTTRSNGYKYTLI